MSDDAKPPSIVCPKCGRRSFNPHDVEEQYCGYCHDWHANLIDVEGVVPLPREPE